MLRVHHHHREIQAAQGLTEIVRTMNHLASLTALRNRYLGLRHGESVANQQGIIVSDPDLGIPHYGLTDHGRVQIAASLAQNPLLNATTRIYSSDFRRARETTEVVLDLLAKAVPITLSPLLRERFFGAWEGATIANYERVWEDDQRDPGHTHAGVESAMAVLERVSRLIRDLEAQWQGHTILLVSHGDPLQILQTGFGKQSPATHRQRPLIQTAELRSFILSAEA